MEHYSVKRTKNKKGVTIPSQKRYIRYFESFLKTNYSFPYIYMIPKIIKYHIKSTMTNILKNFVEDSSYFYQKNSFMINYFEIGPFASQKNCRIVLNDFFYKKINLDNIKTSNVQTNGLYHFRMELTQKDAIRTDLKINVSGSVEFELWCNLWYSALELLKEFIDETFKNMKHHQLFLSNFAHPEHQNKTHHEITKLAYNDHSSDDYTNQKFMKLEPNSATRRIFDDNKLDVGADNTINDAVEDDGVFIESMTNLFEIIEKVNKNETDLILLIENINKICQKEGKQIFNKKSMTVSIPGSQLDSFSDSAKSMKEGFAFKINFSLLDTKK